MSTSLESLESWIDEIRRFTLPEFRKRLLLTSPHSSQIHNLQAEVALLESILGDHDLLTDDQLERAASMQLFEGLQHGIQLGPSNSVETGDDASMRTCLHALFDVDQQLRLFQSLA